MPNWCFNIAVFTCSKAKERKLKKLFTDLAKKEKKEACGQLPSFTPQETGYMFEIRWEDGVLYYDTKWGPNIEVMVAIAEYFRVDFTLEYQELNMQVFGECSFIKGVLTDICLDREDFDMYEVDPGNEDNWLFEGKVYDSDIEIMDILLERKKENEKTTTDIIILPQ